MVDSVWGGKNHNRQKQTANSLIICTLTVP